MLNVKNRHSIPNKITASSDGFHLTLQQPRLVAEPDGKIRMIPTQGLLSDDDSSHVQLFRLVTLALRVKTAIRSKVTNHQIFIGNIPMFASVLLHEQRVVAGGAIAFTP